MDHGAGSEESRTPEEKAVPVRGTGRRGRLVLGALLCLAVAIPAMGISRMEHVRRDLLAQRIVEFVERTPLPTQCGFQGEAGRNFTKYGPKCLERNGYRFVSAVDTDPAFLRVVKVDPAIVRGSSDELSAHDIVLTRETQFWGIYYRTDPLPALEKVVEAVPEIGAAVPSLGDYLSCGVGFHCRSGRTDRIEAWEMAGMETNLF